MAIIVVGDDWDRQKHLSLKDTGTRRNLQGATDGSANGVLCRGKGAIDNFVSLGDIFWRVSANHGAKHVANSAVHAFADSFGLRVICSSRDRFGSG